VKIQANMCILLTTIVTTSTSNIERNRYNITFFDEFYVTTNFDYFTSNLMPQHQTTRSSRSTTDHMLVTSTDVSSNHFKYNPMIYLSTNIERVDPWSITENEIRISNI